ncbi:MAG: hypothetical protein KBF57_13315 [Saprospiraceae bacterium]|nr:hypothetical protein [Saprospiraceae bacterium]
MEFIKKECSQIILPSSRNYYYDAQLLKLNCAEVNDTLHKKYNWSKDNIFLSELTLNKRRGHSEDSALSLLPKSNVISNGLDVTKYAEGLVRHIIAQFKKEMAFCFFDGFRDELKKLEYRDLRVLFANTYGVLDLISDKIYDLEPYMATLRSAMEKDLKVADISVFKLIQDSNSQLSAELDKQKNVRFLSNVGYQFYNAVRDSVHIGRALRDIDTTGYNKNTDQNVVASFETIRLLSNALQDNIEDAKKPFWLDKDKIDTLLSDPILLQYFVGLVVSQSKGIQFNDKTKLYDILNSKANLNKVKAFITDIRYLSNQINEIHKNSNNVKTDVEKENEVFQYFEAASSLISLMQKVNTLHSGVISKEMLDTIQSAINASGEIYKGVYSKQYTLAVLNIGKFLNTVNNGKNDNFQAVIKFIVEKGIFIAQMAEAKTADDVKNILQQFAAASGSWRDKRTAGYNVSIDSYLGGSAYFDGQKSVRYGIYTPVGISVSTSLGKKWAATLLGSVVDLGPLTAYRFSNDTSDIAKIYLKEILAPGAHFSILIPICDCAPLALNIGYQQYPLLTKAGDVANEVNIYKQYGWVAGINYNVPLYTIFNSKKY